MSFLHLDAREVESLFPMAEAVEVVEGALAALARGEAIQPLRQPLWTPDRSGLLGLMPGMLLGTIPEEKGLPPVMGLKAVSVFLGRHPSHQGLVLLFDALRGTPLAILDGESITAIRTAAASGVATRHLAREDAAELAILGAGVQAATHLEAMRAVRPVERVRVWSRTPEHSRRFAEEQSAAHGIPVEPVPSPRDAVDGAGLVCTCTSSAEPVLEGTKGKWLEVGDSKQLNETFTRLHQVIPGDGTSLENVFLDIAQLKPLPDNIYLLTDGLPTQGRNPPRDSTISGRNRLVLFEDAIERLPANVPVNIILLPMEGDPMAASAFWQLSQLTNGSFMSPSGDWP